MRTKQENVYRHRVTGMLVLFFTTHLASILHRRIPLRWLGINASSACCSSKAQCMRGSHASLLTPNKWESTPAGIIGCFGAAERIGELGMKELIKIMLPAGETRRAASSVRANP